MKRFFGALRRAVSWHRRSLAVIAAVLATLVLASLIARPDPPSQWVLVTTAEVSAGAVVTDGDVSRVQMPEAAIPDQVVSEPEDAIGRMAIAALPRNAIITTASVFTPGDLKASPGKAIMPIHLQDAGLRGLLTVGSHVDLIGFSSSTGAAEVLASNVRIVAIPEAEASGTLDTGSDDGLLVVVEVPPDTASALTTASAASSLSVIIR